MSLSFVYDSIAKSWSDFRIRPLNFVAEFLNGRSGLILDAGCGSGRNILSNVSVGVDFSVEMIRIAKERFPSKLLIVADVRALPFKDKVFDFSFSAAVLHHLRPDSCLSALRELKRVTRSECLVSVWDRRPYGESLIKWGSKLRYYYIYSPEEITELISKVFSDFKQLPDKNNTVLLMQ